MPQALSRINIYWFSAAFDAAHRVMDLAPGQCQINRKLTEKELLSSLDEAIEKGWIFSCFQPKVNRRS